MTGVMNYDSVGGFLKNDYNVAGGVVNEYFDFNKHLRYLFCGTCDTQTWTSPIPTYHSDGLNPTGNTMTINGQSCSEYQTTNAGDPVSFLWTNTANGLPCRAVNITGTTIDFSNFAPLNAGSFAAFNGWNCPAQQCNRLMDIALIFDESGSIIPTDFVKEVQFGASVAQNFVFGPNAVGMALIQFSGSARLTIQVTFIQQSFLNAMNAVIQLGGATCIGCGMQLAMQELAANGRPGVPKIYIMLTDGMNNVNVNQFPQILQNVKNNGIVFAIGVGMFTNTAEIEYIASSMNTAFPQVPSFSALQGIVNSLIQATCAAIPGNPCGPTCLGFCSCKGTCICPSTCANGNVCQTGSCTVGVAGSGCTYTPVVCNDNNLCTQDLCNPTTGCYYPTLPCNTPPDICHTTAACVPSLGCQYPPVNCVSTSPCYSSTCVVAAGGCVNTTLPCNHCLYPPVTCPTLNCFNNKCNGTNGQCQATPINCDDGNNCTVDSCDLNTGQCTHTLVQCTDNGNKCVHSSCDPIKGCQYTPFNNSVDCNDNNVCTIDTCDPAVGCVHTNISCTSNNTCITAVCDPVAGCLHSPFNCLSVPRIAKFIGNCYQAICNASSGCLLVQVPGTIIYTCGVCNGNNGCKNLVQLPSNVPLAIAGGSLAAIVVGAVILFIAIAAFGGKKGYDIWLAHRNNMSGASTNPLYNDSGMTGRNPMYSSRITRI
jgi:hypothetical protein